MFRVLTGETMPEERSGTFRTHRKPNSYPCAPHIAHTSRAYLSPIDYTSIQHEITKLSLHYLLPFSFIFEIKEENYHHTTSYHIAHTSRTHRKPIAHPSQTHRKPNSYPCAPPHRAHIAHPSQTQLLPMRLPHRAHIARLFITY
jgi:hypothetical protein